MRTTAPLSRIVDEWLSECDISKVSKADYRRKINLWFRYLSSVGRDPRSPSESDVVRYKEHLQEFKKSAYTCNSYITVVKLFYKWCALKHYWESIGERVHSSSVQKFYNKLPLTLRQSQDLLASIDTTSIIGKRDKLMITLMLFNGLRTCEAHRIDVADFQFVEKVPVLYIQRKGRTDKRESVVLHQESVKLLREYIECRRDKSGPLFVSHEHRNRFETVRLSRGSIRRIIKRRLRLIGIDNPKISAHSLRHTFGCLLVDQGVELDVIRDLMGHSSSQVTRIYIEMSRQRKMLHQSPTIKLGNDMLNYK